MNYVKVTTEAGEEWYRMVQAKSLYSYIRLKNNSGQVTWLYEKQVTEKKEPQEFQTFQEFLDKSQYSINGILRYEKIFGPEHTKRQELTETDSEEDSLGSCVRGFVS